MHITERLWAVVTSVISITSLSSLKDGINIQSPLQIPSQKASLLNAGQGPIFQPPGVPDDDRFECKYPAIVGWETCSTPTDRKCWLRRKSDGKQYDINTNYEDDMPIGITRRYTLNLTDSTWDADGMEFLAAKLFSNTYPGPWIQACWGDT